MGPLTKKPHDFGGLTPLPTPPLVIFGKKGPSLSAVSLIPEPVAILLLKSSQYHIG